MSTSIDSFGAKGTLEVGENSYEIFRLSAVPGTEKLPYSLKVLAENLLRTEDGANITADHIRAIASWDPSAEPSIEIQFTPARVIMQDFTGVPCIVDLATMREAVTTLGGDPNKVNPLSPRRHGHRPLGHPRRLRPGRRTRAQRRPRIRAQRRALPVPPLGARAHSTTSRSSPPGMGIVHQVNIEYLAPTVMSRNGQAYPPDTCVGTDSHTTMVNGLGVLGWGGVGGIEAEAAMLGQPVSMLIPPRRRLQALR